MDMKSILSTKSTSSLSDKEIQFLVDNNYQVTIESPERIRRDLKAMSKLDTTLLDLTDPIIQESINKTKDPKTLVAFYIKCLDDDPSNAHTLDCFKDSFNVVKTLMDLFMRISMGESYLQLAEKGSTGDLFRRAMLHIESAYTVTSTINRKKIIDYLEYSGMYIEEIPYEILTSNTFIEHHLSSKGEDVQRAIFNALNDFFYSPDIEKEFLYAINSEKETIEEYLASQMSHYTEDQIYHLGAIRIYISKLLNNLGIPDYRVCMNTYSMSSDSQGSCYKDRIEMHCYSSRNLEKMIHTGAHEAFHAEQNLNIKYMLLTKDNDIDVYSKDEFIKEIDSTYYGRNYRKVATEYDADLKAKIALFHLKELHLGPFEKLRRIIASKLIREQDQLKGIKSDMIYEAVSTRLDANKKEFPLEVLFDEAIKHEHEESIKNGTYPKFISNIRMKFPIIEFEYAISEDKVERRSVEDLVHMMIKDKNNTDIYRYLIISYLNPRKNINADANRSTLEEVYKDEALPVHIRAYIRECLDNEAMDKYYARVKERSI